MLPYLQDVSQTGIYVLAESDTDSVITVQYGKTTDLGMSTKTEFSMKSKTWGTIYVHRIKLAGLKPETEYYYRVIQNSDTSRSFSFHTASLPGSEFRFAVAGDFRSNPSIHSVVAMEILKHKPNFSIYTGDLCFNGNYTSWKTEFFVDGQQQLIATAPFYNALGNHEAQTKLTEVFLQPPKSKSNNPNYYSFDYGDIHFLILNTQESCKSSSPQYAFAIKDLKSTVKKWKIVAFHKSAYVAGGHGENHDMVAFSQEVLVPNKVAMVLTGHTHMYQRNYVDSVYHLVVAGGGAPLYTPKKAPYVVKSVKDYSYLIVDAAPNSLKATAYDIHGNIIDSFELKK